MGLNQTIIGRYNIVNESGDNITASVNGDLFTIGNGYNSSTDSSSGTATRSNAFRVSVAGTAYGLAAFQGSGADYAEMWE